MPRKPKGVSDAEEIKRATVNWFMTVDSSPEGVGDWDIKQDVLAEAVLKILASGCAIMFGTTFDGTAVTCTIFQDDHKLRTFVTDAVELDDWSMKVVATARKAAMPRIVPGAAD